jgi:hypothetical protein
MEFTSRPSTVAVTPSRKHPSAAFWATVLVVVALTAYPLSLGPACWIVGDNETAISAILNVYYPILWAARATRRESEPGAFEASRLDKCIIWYSTIGRDDGAYPELHSGAGKMWLVPERRPW